MSVPGLIFALVIAGLLAAIIVLPLMQSGTRRGDDQDTRQYDRARLYYERVLRNLRDLDEDYALGKLDEVSYRVERELWTERGIQVLKAIDRLEAGELIAAGGASDAEIDHALDDTVEAAIRAAREQLKQ